MVNITKY